MEPCSTLSTLSDLTLSTYFRVQLGAEADGVAVGDAVELRRESGGRRRRQHLLLHAAVRRTEVVAGAACGHVLMIFKFGAPFLH